MFVRVIVLRVTLRTLGVTPLIPCGVPTCVSVSRVWFVYLCVFLCALVRVRVYLCRCAFCVSAVSLRCVCVRVVVDLWFGCVVWSVSVWMWCVAGLVLRLSAVGVCCLSMCILACVCG